MTDPRFHLYLDSAHLDDLAACLPHPLIYGVTTNPTLLLRAGVSRAALPGHLKRILALGVRKVQAQVGSAGADAMVKDAHELLSALGPQSLIVKIPATREGFRAGAKLVADGAVVTYTAVYAPEQALFAALSGAAYAAPYLGRLNDSGVDGLALIAQMQRLLDRQASGTRLLVASVRSREAFVDLLGLGVGSITIPTALWPALIDQPATLAAEQGFLADAAKLG
jgi:transaldolase